MQKADALTKEDADTLIEIREAQGFSTDEYAVKGTAIPIENGKGVFYIIAVVPELAPNRVKVGFTNDIDGRLAAHRTAAPTAQVIMTWPCKRTWEMAAIDSITREECKLIANEVYEVDSADRMIQRGNIFFALMPKV